MSAIRIRLIIPSLVLCFLTNAANAEWPLPWSDEIDKADVKIGDDNNAFYYESGQKVYLLDTGYGVARLRDGVNPEALETGDANPELFAKIPEFRALLVPLSERQLVLFRNGDNGGPRDLERFLQPRRELVEYVLPVVRRSEDDPDEPNAPLVLTDRITVRFAESVPTEARLELIKQSGLKVLPKRSFVPDSYLLTLAEGAVTYTRLLRCANRLHELGSKDRSLLYCFPDFITPTRPAQVPNPGDPLLNQQWHLENTGQGGGTIGADAKVRKAWTTTTGSRHVLIAVVDDSVERDHPDLRDNYINGIRLLPDGSDVPDPTPRKNNEIHGTCCAGIAVACSNCVGGRGVAPTCGLIAVSVPKGSANRLADALYYCKQQRASIITYSETLLEKRDDVRLAVKDITTPNSDYLGIVIVTAAGNGGGNVRKLQVLSHYDGVVCVGATNHFDHHAEYSNHGAELDIVAPSGNQRLNTWGILTTDNTDSLPRRPPHPYSGLLIGDYTQDGSNFKYFSGTSGAAPIVAGVCALMRSANSKMTSVEVIKVLLKSSDPIPGSTSRPANYDTQGHDDYYGVGRVNAEKAVLAAGT